MDTTDKMLIDAHVRGDKAAFAQIVQRHGDGLYGYLVRMTGDVTCAEDAFQETFWRVHCKAHTLKGNNFKGWLFRIATNVAVSDFRKRKRGRAISLDRCSECQNGDCHNVSSASLTDCSAEPSLAVERDEMKRQLRGAIAALPARQKATLVMAYYQGMTYTDIAAALGCSSGSVKTHMFRALKTLGRCLGDMEGDIS